MHLFCLASTAPKAKKFLVKPSDLMILHNENAILECIVTGYPKPQVDWYKDGTKLALTQSGHYSEYGASSLMVSTAKAADSGKYECVMGTEKAEANLKVFGKNLMSRTLLMWTLSNANSSYSNTNTPICM